MNQHAGRVVFPVMLFTIGLLIGFVIHPITIPSESLEKADNTSGSSVKPDAAGSVHEIQTLQDKVRRLNELNSDLRGQLENLHSATNNRNLGFGITPEYVKELPYKGLSDNLIVTTEGLVAHEMSADEASKLNTGLRLIFEDIKNWEIRNAITDSETEDKLVITIPPQNSSNIRREVRKLFNSTLVIERGGEFFNKNHYTLLQTLSGFGEYSRILTVEKHTESNTRLYDAYVDSEGHTPFSNRIGIPKGDNVPLAYRHLLELVNEENSEPVK